MSSAFDGAGVWIWELINSDGGDYDAIAARCTAAGVRWVAVKVWESGHWFIQRDKDGLAPFTKIASELQKRGLIAVAWGYTTLLPAGSRYPVTVDNPPYVADGPDAEAQILVQTILTRDPAYPEYQGPVALILDIEDETAGQWQAALQLISTLKAAAPKGLELAYSPLPIIHYHADLPYRQFTDAGYTMLPQLYWTGIGWSVAATTAAFYGDIAKYALGSQPILPVYEDAPGDRPDPTDISPFLATVKAQGSTGVSVWCYQELDDAGWQRLASVAAAFAPAPPPPPDPGDLEKQIADLTARLHQAQQQEQQDQTLIQQLTAARDAAEQKLAAVKTELSQALSQLSAAGTTEG